MGRNGRCLNKTPFVFYLSLVLLTMTMFSTHFMSGLYARYTTVDGGGDEARVATFNVSENIVFNGTPVTLGIYELETTFDKIDTEGEFVNPKYTFSVTNSSEVAVRYFVTVKNFTNNLLLDFSIKSNISSENTMDGVTVVLYENGMIKRVYGDGTVVCEVNLGPNEPMFTFDFEMQLSEKDSKYSGKVDYVTITVTAEQID